MTITGLQYYFVNGQNLHELSPGEEDNIAAGNFLFNVQDF